MKVNILIVRQCGASYADNPQASVHIDGWSGGSLTAGLTCVTVELTRDQAEQLLHQLADSLGCDLKYHQRDVSYDPPAGRRPTAQDSDVCLG